MGLMRRAAWPAITFLLMIASFAIGRSTGGFHSLPEIAATLPGDESEFSRKLDERIRQRFPAGAREQDLIAYLDRQGFVPEWRERDDPNAGVFLWSGLICKKTLRVLWRADETGALTEVSGAYESHCL